MADMPAHRGVRAFLYFVLATIALHLLLLAGVFVAMLQPPRTFGRFMKHVPMPAMMTIPFRPFWFFAREGKLKPGAPTPDFELDSVDRQSRVRLSSLRGKPVVLVFGSYT